MSILKSMTLPNERYDDYILVKKYFDSKAISLNAENILSIEVDNIDALSFATSGANGNPGEVNIILSNNDQVTFYKGNYEYKKTIGYDLLLDQIPILKLDTQKNVEKYLDKWGTSCGMGLGNELFINKKIAKQLEEKYINSEMIYIL